MVVWEEKERKQGRGRERIHKRTGLLTCCTHVLEDKVSHHAKAPLRVQDRNLLLDHRCAREMGGGGYEVGTWGRRERERKMHIQYLEFLNR